MSYVVLLASFCPNRVADVTEGQDIVRVEEQSRVVAVLPDMVAIFGQSVLTVVAHGSEGQAVFP